MRKWRIKHYFLIAIFFIASYFASAQTNATLNSTLPTYKIGVLFPDPVSVRASDPTLNDMIVASEVAISMAAANISRNNIIPDVQLNFIRFYSNDSNVGQTAWTTVNMVEAGINAVIGDMVSSVTEAEAGITGVRHIPQCSCASASVDLSDKSAYPYFFRTVGDVVLYGRSLVDWVQHMGWNMFALIYTNDNVGQQVLSAMVSRAQEYGIQAMTQIPLYDLNNVEASLERLVNSGARIVIFADSDTSDQLTVLKAAMSMGLLSEGWVWMLTNDMSPAIRDMVETQEELDAYDGLMFISGIWNLTGIPAYDSMVNEWRQQPVPGNFTTPSAWNTMGLSYNAPNAYACAELLALGLNKALNEYSGGRHAGLSDLAAGKFDSTNMIPAFYNLNYTGPAGAMEFFDTGNLKTGYFSLQYMLEGSVVTYATLMDGNFSFVNDTPIIYLGHSLKKPVDMVAKYALNPTLSSPAGITVATISAIGLVACLLMLILIISFRGLKAIMIASPFFCCVQLVGLMLTYISTLLYLDKPNIAKCIARQFTMTCGFVFVIGGIIAKSYRIYRIFQNVFTVRTSRLKSAYLIRIIVVFGVIALLPLIVWHIVYPVEVYDIMISAETYCWLCVYPHAPADWLHLNVAQLVVLIWGAVLVVLAALLAFKTRKVRGKWAETNQIAYVSYNTLLAACLACPGFFLPIESYQIALYLKLSAMLFAATVTLFVLFFPLLTVISRFICFRYLTRPSAAGDICNDSSDGSPAGQAYKSYYHPGNTQRFNENLAAKNLLDFSVQAHEGVLPVKKVTKFNFMSIWELKHVLVIPSNRFFVLMDQSGRKAQMHEYMVCEVVSCTSDRSIFRVITIDNTVFLFQVNDQIALQRWIQWFHGPTDSVTDSKDFGEPERFIATLNMSHDLGGDGSLSSDAFHLNGIRRKATAAPLFRNPLATFGAVRNTLTSSFTSRGSNGAASSSRYHHRPSAPNDDLVNDSSDLLVRTFSRPPEAPTSTDQLHTRHELHPSASSIGTMLSEFYSPHY